MSNDKAMGYRRVSRREALRLVGGCAACLILGSIPRRVAGGPSPACVFRPQQTEGPYFVDERLHRSDIRSDPTTGKVQPGTPFGLTVAVSHVENGQCHPLAGAQVDIWHCDARGIYSDVKDPNFNTIGQKFLRGYQITDPLGEARFLTIYPGWYPGRTVHIHVKIRTAPQKHAFELTTQMYFEDAMSDRVFADPPYAEKGARVARNQDDRIFRRGGEQLLLKPTPAHGFSAIFSVGLQLRSI
jgi:protocatechuate 3,4-dioxygenase beta subunit